MQIFMCIATFIAIAVVMVAGSPVMQQNSSGAAGASNSAAKMERDHESDDDQSQQMPESMDLARFRKAAFPANFGGTAINYGNGLPCPRNYLFSCQPNLAPVPCGGGYGGGYPSPYPANLRGSGSAPVPAYIAPPQFLPQQQYMAPDLSNRNSPLYGY